ncbi:hypothetical protein KC367_g9110 [Hortaea werneckii]|uniref:Uncharacterized protein n=1 Tax=Hortaea werneckii TaxID=91943 RepID=A0A3M7I082_HORWE|nr:hypothetical protein KC329_g17470 [Hortaea werneckii]KAI7252543.1 hypothetical protein KC335_g15663 [Hortaea werneckii]KAI7379155.1 hypothetical protein KC332_g17561 [Hortaea werneckii]KAI7428481.1 hypothetical protein KC368_g17610 [Hortaea werneckii]KAI7492388.1 hypothetical protein KC367_g9110 [Hortaea werneckii]
MNNVCTRCALRLQRTATHSAESSTAARRAFTSSAGRRKHHGIPNFSETANDDLNNVLASMRSTHFIPGYLPKQERRMILGRKYRQQLQDNPVTVNVADEEVNLEWLDREKDIPNRTDLFHRAIDLMASTNNWTNLPSLLTGLKHSGAKLDEKALGKTVRKAASAGRIGIIIQCLQQSTNTGLTLRHEEVLQNVLWALHSTPQLTGWQDEEALLHSLKAANQIALLLETPEHNPYIKTTKNHILQPHDPRRRPEVLALFLELAAVYSWRFQAGKDTDGKVMTYTSRLLSILSTSHPEARQLPGSLTPRKSGPQREMLMGIPLWQGLSLAEKILAGGSQEGGKKGSGAVSSLSAEQFEMMTRVREDYESGLRLLAEALQAEGPREGSYADQALRWWRDCVRD